eukprot:CAMPEP_0177652002 /NCGR_PEP_ID=MMETSP0447-20121125/12869_1 /TAXON_ID=0 /ORGANISM="Stygamoeba regulata, Strain BSH-02190019" /LENGTH=93 /DNA_ID=CAMNT_0019155161 /DNA_START=106 /DNA_END=387 /DNA_ORIENTATION=-
MKFVLLALFALLAITMVCANEVETYTGDLDEPDHMPRLDDRSVCHKNPQSKGKKENGRTCRDDWECCSGFCKLKAKSEQKLRLYMIGRCHNVD